MAAIAFTDPPLPRGTSSPSSVVRSWSHSYTGLSLEVPFRLPWPPRLLADTRAHAGDPEATVSLEKQLAALDEDIDEIEDSFKKPRGRKTQRDEKDPKTGVRRRNV